MGYLGLIAKTNKLNHNFQKSRNEILNIRERRFRALLKYAYYNSEFYHEYYDSYGIRDRDIEEVQINKLPCIDKKLFIENFNRIVTDKRLSLECIERFLMREKGRDKKYLGEYTIVHSSGSTGKPTCFIYDRSSWETILASGFRACKGEVRLKEAISKGLRGFRVLYIAATEGRFGGAMAAHSGIKGFGFHPLLLNINLPLEIWIDKINDFNPDVIIGYPSAVKILCDLISENKIKINAFRIITGGEPLIAEQRKYFQSVLHTDIFNIYGASESIILGLERDAYQGFYIFDDINYLEIDEESTFITPLYNYSQPLIRYKLTDKLMSTERMENETLPFSKIREVMGRNEEIMWFLNDNGEKDFLHPLIINTLEAEGIIKYQFVQRSNKCFEIRVESRKNTDSDTIEIKLRKQMDNILKEKNLTCLNYQIKQVDTIPINASTGKSKIVIKEY
ncbi:MULTISPECIES: phenylacetate--CoA ligase family protein [Thermotaleaceae]|uniref:Phenylacetate-CoA ligase n=1 Tax=Geosporobacter subterraneus DSM 17957 TaxID=1121919 RepID=A0A1M6Q0N1_9FIRM|nr:phenylacetate--CoA ligase family protein [Geosporobacter subterraneus]NLI93148.1 phenylacetate--CoA ligase family protein [Peptococcaceae bacterium]SHK13723.1 phenylacetate-CoA ligase [Geosporobacter subterraneus DSM 17957]